MMNLTYLVVEPNGIAPWRILIHSPLGSEDKRHGVCLPRSGLDCFVVGLSTHGANEGAVVNAAKAGVSRCIAGGEIKCGEIIIPDLSGLLDGAGRVATMADILDAQAKERVLMGVGYADEDCAAGKVFNVWLSPIMLWHPKTTIGGAR